VRRNASGWRNNAGEREQLKKVAQTWLLLAKASEDLTEAEQRLHSARRPSL
jgi:hypothetical protein